MTDPQRSLIAVLLDRSGSMESIRTDTQGGFDAFIGQQRAQSGDARVTLAQFDTEYEVVYANRPIADVPALELLPRGGTALYDGIGRLVTDVGAELASLPAAERPGSVVVVVLTDGHENSSTEWTHEAVSALIRRQEGQYSWTFVFLGANMDAVTIGSRLGFAADRSLTYAPSAAGVGAAFAASADLVARRIATPPGMPVDGFSESERSAAGRSDV